MTSEKLSYIMLEFPTISREFVVEFLVLGWLKLNYDSFLVDCTVSEVYFSSDFGGELLAQSKQCTLHKRMDRLWVIPRSRHIDDGYSLLLRLEMTDFSGKINILKLK